MSKFVSLDIETLGLAIDSPIIELGAVLADWMTGQTIGEFHSYVLHDSYDNCEPYAMSMHPTILRRIATQEGGWLYTHIDKLAAVFEQWLCKCGQGNRKLVIAGKNVNGFDIPRLRVQCMDWELLVKTHHRVIDPGMLFWHPAEDNVPPGSATCQERAGQDPEVKHTALEDARAVTQQVFVAVGRRVSPSAFIGEENAATQ
jgi:DNA polymerase III epsilon subunit-like protein